MGDFLTLHTSEGRVTHLRSCRWSHTAAPGFPFKKRRRGVYFQKINFLSWKFSSLIVHVRSNSSQEEIMAWPLFFFPLHVSLFHHIVIQQIPSFKSHWVPVMWQPLDGPWGHHRFVEAEGHMVNVPVWINLRASKSPGLWQEDQVGSWGSHQGDGGLNQERDHGDEIVGTELEDGGGGRRIWR